MAGNYFRVSLDGSTQYMPFPEDDGNSTLSFPCSYPATTGDDPVRIFDMLGGYLETRKYQPLHQNLQYLHDLHKSPDSSVSPSSISTIMTGNPSDVISIVILNQNSKISIYYVIGEPTQLNVNVDFLIYEDTVENAKALTVSRWDEQPSSHADDPTNINPSGGEFADTDPFDHNEPLSTLDFLTDPAWDMPYRTDAQGNFRTVMYAPYALFQPNLDFFGECMWYNGTGGVMHELQSLFGGRVDPNAAGITALFNLPLSSSTIGQIQTGDGYATPIYLCGNEVTDGNGNAAVGFHLTKRFHRVSLGSIILKEVWGTAKDYTDTTIDIFLPFVGVKSLDPVHCINRKLDLVCTIDVFTGDILYVIYSSNSSLPLIYNPVGDQYFYQSSPVYRFSGNCAAQLPFSVGSNAALRDSVVGLGSSLAMAGVGLAAGFLTGGTAAPMSAAMIASSAMSAGAAVTGGVHNIMQANKAGVQANGSSTIGGATGKMDYVKAFLIVTRPVPQYPNGWREQIGGPRYQTLDIDSLEGFTLFAEIKLDDIEGATDAELLQLQRELLTEGIIL